MLLKKISTRIALQFTGFVFLLLMLNGLFFFAADLTASDRRMGRQLEHAIAPILNEFQDRDDSLSPPPPPLLPLPLRGRVRIMDVSGSEILTGPLFQEIPFTRARGFSDVTINNEEFRVITEEVRRGGALRGFIQIVEPSRMRGSDLLERIAIYLAISVLVSLATYGVGYLFARRSLRPAEEAMERLEQFTQDASHELRTPLAALSSSLDLALKTKEYRTGILSAKEDIGRFTALIERLLELTRLDQLLIERAPVDLSALILSAIESIRPLAATHHVTIVSSLEPNVTVEGDAMLLRQVMDNLLSNAMKFQKSDGGQVTVRLNHDRLSVEDTGIGMDATVQHKIFARFYQADSSRSEGGFGLGLALVKRIVDLHGWTIAVKSDPGKGSTFTINFTV